MNPLIKTSIVNYKTVKGIQYKKLDTSFQVYGRPLHTAPIVVVFHALTGNSDICSPDKGWWKEIIGVQKVIDLSTYTVIAFNILGNGYDGTLVTNYKDFTARDIAILSYQTLQIHGVDRIHSVIGGSLGGGIAWELLTTYPGFSKNLIAVACDWQSSDWVKGICGTQEQILLNSSNPIADARKMAMFFYRTPQSINQKFKGEKQNPHLYKVNSWLNHHGKKLEQRFSLQAYLMMNNLLESINCTIDFGKIIDSIIIQIGISSDILFSPDRNKETKQFLDQHLIPNYYYEINSNDGHDAFLIEHEQLSRVLEKHF